MASLTFNITVDIDFDDDPLDPNREADIRKAVMAHVDNISAFLDHAYERKIYGIISVGSTYRSTFTVANTHPF